MLNAHHRTRMVRIADIFLQFTVPVYLSSQWKKMLKRKKLPPNDINGKVVEKQR